MSYQPRKVYDEALLEGVALSGEIKRAAELAGVTERAIHKRRRSDPDFAAELEAAQQRFREASSRRGVQRVRSRLRRPDLDEGA